MSDLTPGELSPTVPNMYRLKKLFTAKLPELKYVKFGTSGHRGKLGEGFHKRHVLAVAQAVADFRKEAGYKGKILIGGDTRVMSATVARLCAEVLATNGCEVMLASHEVPTPIFSTYVRHDPSVSDAIIGTASHNPPDEMGIKYNPSHGGPAGKEVTDFVQQRANVYLANPDGIHHKPLREVKSLVDTKPNLYDLYFERLEKAVDLKVIRESGLKLKIHPLGGAAVSYFKKLSKKLVPSIEIVDETLDPTFGFVPLDHDRVIRMDPSSVYPMRPLLALVKADEFMMAGATDPDADRFGVASGKTGLLTPNQALCVAAEYLLSKQNGKFRKWPAKLTLGRTIGTTHLLDKIAASHGIESIDEVPVGFKWFVEGLDKGRYALVGEESAGLSFYQWTTEKDGIAALLLFAEIMAVTGKNLGELYAELEAEHGQSFYSRSDIAADEALMNEIRKLKAKDVAAKLDALSPAWTLSGTPVKEKLFDGDGVKIYLQEDKGFVLVRPSGTENKVKFYTESLVSEDHRAKLEEEARELFGL